ncbi:MAG: hypothetical protein IJ831_11750 [Spirochaetales bacterium]|nr:hypothetical protein [Spirochaetales bacterium]
MSIRRVLHKGLEINIPLSKSFDEEIELFSQGALPSDHVFKLGSPSEVLKRAGFPVDKIIELKGSILKTKEGRHLFSASELKGLVEELAHPIAVFSYWGNRGRNVIVDVSKGEKKYLIGVQFVDRENKPLEVSSIRTVFPKDSGEWLHWFEQGKGLYVDKKTPAVNNPTANQSR